MRKAMWPAVVMVGHAHAAGRHRHSQGPGCSAPPMATSVSQRTTPLTVSPVRTTLGHSRGPSPTTMATATFEDHNLLLQGQTYLFVVDVEDTAPDLTIIDVQSDDEDGDADIEATPPPLAPRRPGSTCRAAASTTLT